MIPYLVLACRLVIAGVFVVSLLSKVRGRSHFEEFVVSVVAMGVVPRAWSGHVAFATIAGEACAVLLVVLPFSTAPVGFGISAGMLAAFTLGILIAMRRGNRSPCRCFGASTTPVGLSHVIRNMALLAVCSIGLVGSLGTAHAVLELEGVLVALGGSAVATLFVLRADDIVALFAPDNVPVAGYGDVRTADGPRRT